MPDLPPNLKTDDHDAQPGWEPTTGAPRWVKLFVLVAVVVVLLFIAGMLTGIHDPSRFHH